MSLINSVHDLRINETYFLCPEENGKPFRSTYLGCVKTIADPDFYFKHQERRGFKGGISYFGIDDIGIGTTKEQALANYGKWKIELPKAHFPSRELSPFRME